MNSSLGLKTIVFLLLVFQFGFVYSNEPVLTLTKKKGSRVKEFEEGKRMKVFTADGGVYKGRLKLKGDAIVIDGNEIKTEDITNIRTKALASTVTGAVLSVPGGFFSIVGVAALGQSLTETNECSKGILIIAGVFSLGVGTIVLVPGVLLITVGKRHKVEKWSYDVSSSTTANMRSSKNLTWMN